jgi:hypothetical protein
MIPLEEYLTLPGATHQTTTEPEVQEVKKKPYGQAQLFTFLKTDQPCKEITRSAQLTIDRLGNMPLKLESAHDLYLHTLHSQTLLNKNLELLTLSKGEYGEKKTALTLPNNQFEAKLKNASINTTPLHFPLAKAPKTAMEHLREDPLWVYKLEKAEQNRAIAQMGNAVVTAIEQGIGEWLKEIKANVEDHGQRLLNKNPLLRKRCEQVTQLGKAICTYLKENSKELLGKTPLPELIQKAHSLYVRSQNNHSLADELERQFNIPRELGLRYEKDCAGLLPYFIPYATLGKLGKLPFTAKDGVSNALTGIVKDIYYSVKGHPDLPLYQMIGDATKDIVKILPSYDSDALSVGSWLKAIHGDQIPLNPKPAVHYFKEALDYRVAKLGDSSIIKEGVYRSEIINEFIGLDFLHSLQLQHLQLPKVSALGTRIDEKYAFIAKSYLPGDTMETLFQNLSASAPFSEKRNLLYKELCDASISLGCATGELHNKSIHYSSSPSQHSISITVANFLERIADAEGEFKLINTSLKLGNPQRFSPAIENFLRDPGPASYCFSDITKGQFIWNPVERKWGYADAATVPLSFTPTGKPLLSTPEEFYAFMHCFESEGLATGLLPSEIVGLKEAFSLGYRAEYTGAKSAAAEHFFDIYSSVDTIAYIAEELVNKTSSHASELIVRRLLRDLEQKITQGK